MTDTARLLEVLSDGEPHGHRELYRLGMIVHSRVSDLRKQGHVIAAWREGDTYWYQLTPLGAAVPPQTCPEGSADDGSLDESTAASSGVNPPGGLPDAAQLSLAVA